MVLALFLLGLLPVVFLPEARTELDVADDGPSGGTGAESDLVKDLVEQFGDEPLTPVVEDDVVTTDDPGDDAVLLPDSEDDVVLLPVDEDDVGGGNPGQDNLVVLAPLIEDDISGMNPPVTNPTEVLAPVIEDDVAEVAESDAVLDPVIEDDLMPAGETPNVLNVTNTKPAVVDGFDPTEDILLVSLNAEHFKGPLDIQTTLSEDEQDSLIFVDGKLITMLKAVVGIDASHVYVQASAKQPV